MSDIDCGDCDCGDCDCGDCDCGGDNCCTCDNICKECDEGCRLLCCLSDECCCTWQECCNCKDCMKSDGCCTCNMHGFLCVACCDADDCFDCCEQNRGNAYNLEQQQKKNQQSEEPVKNVVTNQPMAFDAGVDTPPITAQPT